jgi:hypothetical protein
VTGISENDYHMGNGVLAYADHPERYDSLTNSNVTRLSGRFDTTPYPRATSDIIALMLLDDSVRMHDLITAARFETLLAQDEFAQHRIDQAALTERIRFHSETLLAYLLFRNETPLKGRLEGTAGIESWFAKDAPRDRQGRSLKDLDMSTRMFKYPCHYLVYSDQFASLPVEVKQYLWGRLGEVLAGKDNSPLYANMPAKDRQAVKEILLDTLPEFKRWTEQTGRRG